jgi:hypothetical protein
MNKTKERKMKNVIVALLLAFGFASNAHASVRVYNPSGSNLGNFTDLKVTGGLTVSQVSGKAQISRNGGLNSQTAVSGDLSASQCGYTITSDDTGQAAELYNLPAISSSILGCRYTFIVGVTGGPSKMAINPADANKILQLTNAAGDSITADDTGESVVLEAIQPGWAPVGSEKGTWTDAN